MATATTARPGDGHPWLDAFLADPVTELDKLLSGHAGIAPYESADAPDAARLLFGALPRDGEALNVLDQALYEWLDSERRSGVPPLDPLRLERWVRKISEGFEIVGLLKLPRSSVDFRKRYPVWNSWADHLVVSEQRDGRYAFLRTLALAQRVVAEADPEVNPFALEALWLRLCEQAGTAFPARYRDIGFLGLRMLPERDDAPSERPWMTGLVRWAVGQNPSVEEFSRQWWALKALYPRMPAYWRTALTETLHQESAKQISEELQDWWQQDVNAQASTAASQPPQQPVGIPRLTPLSAITALRDRATNPLSTIEKEIIAIIAERERYAETTGESYYLVTTACNLGMAVIEGTDDPVSRGRLAADLARKALAWQSANVYAWALWRDALAKQGAVDAAELVGWETIRRFPENVQWRNQLAELLVALGRIDEADGILDEVFSHRLEDAASFSLRARLLYRSGNYNSARSILVSGLERFSDDLHLQTQLETFDVGKPLILIAEAYRPTDGKFDLSLANAAASEGQLEQSFLRYGNLRRLHSQFERRQGDDDWRTAALGEVRDILSEDPNLAYAQYLSQELTGGDTQAPTGRSFAIAFIDALERKDVDRLSALGKSFSGHTPFIDVAKAFLFGETASADRALAWLSQDVKSEPRTASALRGFLKERFDVSALENRADFAEMIVANDNIQSDLIESLFAGDEMLLAA